MFRCNLASNNGNSKTIWRYVQFDIANRCMTNVNKTHKTKCLAFDAFTFSPTHPQLEISAGVRNTAGPLASPLGKMPSDEGTGVPTDDTKSKSSRAMPDADLTGRFRICFPPEAACCALLASSAFLSSALFATLSAFDFADSRSAQTSMPPSG